MARGRGERGHRADRLFLTQLSLSSQVPPPPEIIIPEDLEEVNEDDDEEMERLACLEDIRLEEERIQKEKDEREFAERYADTLEMTATLILKLD